jgi:hypothetical protein
VVSWAAGIVAALDSEGWWRRSVAGRVMTASARMTRDGLGSEERHRITYLLVPPFVLTALFCAF